MMKTIFPEKLKELRKVEKLTIVELSEKIGYSKSIISYWENGIKEPTLSAIRKLANYFEITVGELIGDDDFRDANNFTAEETRLINAYRRLSRDGKILIQNTVSTLLHTMEE